MKRISLSFIVLLFFCCPSFAQQVECDNCLPSTQIGLSDAIIKKYQSEKYDEEKNNKMGAVVNAAFNYLKEHDESSQCFNKVIGSGGANSYSVQALRKTENEIQFRLMSKCGDLSLASSVTSFSWDDSPEALKAAGERAAQLLMPLGEKIRVNARNHRDQDTRYMLNGEKAKLEITLKDPNVSIGGTTEMNVIMRDCDGYLLKNRPVSFTAETVNGRFIPGVIGGVVTPASGTTDSEGRLKLKFKRTAKNASICGHYKGYNAADCEDAVVGVTHVGDIPVTIVCNYEYAANGGAMGGGNFGSAMGTAEQNFYLTYYYYPKSPLKDSFAIYIPGSKDHKVEYFREEGGYKCVNSLAVSVNINNGTRVSSGSINKENHTYIAIRLNPSPNRFDEDGDMKNSVLIIPAYTPAKDQIITPKDWETVSSREKAHDKAIADLIALAYGIRLPGDDLFIPLPSNKNNDEDLVTPLPKENEVEGKSQELNNPINDIFITKMTNSAKFKKPEKFTKEQNPWYKAVYRIQFDRKDQLPQSNIFGTNVNVTAAATVEEHCLVEVWIPR